MISLLRMVNFKNFADETLKVGPFTVIVGANASGKSNIRDAFRFLHGIGRGDTRWRRFWAGSTGRVGAYCRVGQGFVGRRMDVDRFQRLLGHQGSSTSTTHVEAKTGGRRI